MDLSREPDAVKGEYGHVVVVGGSDRYPNTPGIVAGGALRIGVDLVTVCAPATSALQAAGVHLNTMLAPLEGDRLRGEHVSAVVDAAEQADVVVVGNGVGRDAESLDAVREVVSRVDCPVVVDADGIRAVDEQVLDETCVVTPHVKEFAVLTGSDPAGIDEREELVQEAAASFGCTVLLKGPTDIVSNGRRVVRNETGNPSMTRGGTGDVLAGIVAGFVGRGLEPFPAAVEGARVNGLAGDAAVEVYGDGYLLEELLRQVAAVRQG